MLRVGVELPPGFDSAGEFLADARAYEAAGADAIWLRSPGLEPLTLLAAVAAVTSRARLATSAPGSPWPAGLLEQVAVTLQRLSRGRLVLGLDADPVPGHAEALIEALRAAGAAILVVGSGEEALRCAARLGDGLVTAAAGAEAAAAAFQRARELRRAPGGGAQPGGELELWARVPAPGGRAEWRELQTAYEAAGATGVIVAHAPNLLDILRNPEEDDRQDLAMTVG
jgi:alkanesulfonate monooxygenase SsuD/methylene tetrahydromethanopterin reductase-like flavin-dependent oxidoreductase (luciferase family)